MHTPQEVIIVGHQVFMQLAALKLLPALLADRVVDVAYLFAEVTKRCPFHHQLCHD